MSSRAVRKALRQKELEEEDARRLEAGENESDSDAGVTLPANKSTKSAFALLDQGDSDDEDDDEDEASTNVTHAESDTSHTRPQVREDNAQLIQATQVASARRKKRKQKRKMLGPQGTSESTVDEIDAALEALMLEHKGTTADIGTPATSAISDENANLYRLLSIDTQHLHAENEMRRLFGRAALDSDADHEPHGRRHRGQQRGGLAAALGRRQGANGGRGAGLGLLGLRRNIFVQGKDDWPQGTSGGLAMEITEKASDGTVWYRFTHNMNYQDVQRQFETCVESMDSERMVQLLQYNPYHISTLLQVSEIARQERDHTTSGMLLERALFTFGRSVHTSFAASLAAGKARLDFRRFENREFWLAANRYMTNLSMRSTWRTVFEWAKLMLSLDPINDPYRISLVIDQYALRARQPQQLIDMSADEQLTANWSNYANIQLSRSLALVQTGQEAKGKQALYSAISKFPHVVAALLKQLGVDAPPGVWGKSPRTDWESLHCELYSTRAKDIWNLPESTDLLVELAAAISADVSTAPLRDDEIVRNEARHVLLTDVPAFIALLPKSLSSQVGSMSDPLPPLDDLRSYDMDISKESRSHPLRATGAVTAADFFHLYIQWINEESSGDAQHFGELSEDDVRQRLTDGQRSPAEVERWTRGVLAVQSRLVQHLQQMHTHESAGSDSEQEEVHSDD